jgi:cell division protein FtsL
LHASSSKIASLQEQVSDQQQQIANLQKQLQDLLPTHQP